MTTLLVLYDGRCPFCCACRDWVLQQPQLVPIVFDNCWRPENRERYGSLPLGTKLVVVDHLGQAYWGPAAFLVVLWALAPHRPLAMTLSTPGVRFLTDLLFEGLSSFRGVLGWVWGVPPCQDGACGVTPMAHGPFRRVPSTDDPREHFLQAPVTRS